MAKKKLTILAIICFLLSTLPLAIIKQYNEVETINKLLKQAKETQNLEEMENFLRELIKEINIIGISDYYTLKIVETIETLEKLKKEKNDPNFQANFYKVQSSLKEIKNLGINYFFSNLKIILILNIFMWIWLILELIFKQEKSSKILS